MGRSDRGSGGSAPPAPADVLPCLSRPALAAPAEVLPASAEVGPYPPPGGCLRATIGANVFSLHNTAERGGGFPKVIT